MKSAKYSFWPLALALITGLVFAAPAHALRVNFSPKGDSDVLTFAFDSAELPKYSVRRTGAQEVMVTLPGTIWSSETKPGNKDYPGKLVRSILATESGVRITTRTKGFGFIKLPAPGKPQFVLQLYRDPIGARWKPPAAKKPKPTPVAKTVAPTPKPTPKPAPKPAAKVAPSAPKPVPKPSSTPQPAPESVAQPEEDVFEVTTPAPRPEPVAESVPRTVSVPQSVQQAVTPPSVAQQPAPLPVQGEADLPPESASGERKPFFSVPYSVRNQVSSPEAPQQVSGNYPPSSELRFKAVNLTAEEVKYAELAGSESARAPVVGGGPAEQGLVASGVVESVPDSQDDGGEQAVSGAVMPQPQVEGAVSAPLPEPVAQAVTPPAASGQGQAGGSVASAPVAQPQAVPVQPVDAADDVFSAQVAPVDATEPVSGHGQAGGAVAPPPSVVQGAPPPAPTEEESARVVEVVEESPVEEVPAEESPIAEEVVLPEADSLASTPEGEGVAPAASNATDPAKEREEEIRNQLYEAQSMMFNGNLMEALPLYEDILKQPEVPEDVREETLYAVADIKKQLHDDQLDEYFEEIAQSYIEAMNSNLRSNKVPRALLNLGLLNLKVGNFPEAKAYFKILQDKYPDDDNIPSISYYWGEYYYKKGDYKKAADQFQYLIQTYPEHQLVKQAAYYLADALNRTGFIEQAFQIVDYIDKRWPDYYMENNQFLRLAGGVELQLGKWPAAKNHYFTYYNLNPEADGADVVLARIGDIYIRLGQKRPARQIYEKVVKNYPDMEGALIAKMRLAEEGIFDDPSMMQMVDVFDRPYNLKPVKIYTDIVENFPDSPLAPIAQLKLAMWYAFNKKYPEALSAAQDLIEKFPDSPLVDRAKKLGDSVFALAVPGMVGEERYGRVVRYWETYDFLGKENTKVDDQTLLLIATSYWKVGQHDKALEIIKPFLGKRQIKNVSDEALGLAVNIYLDQLAWKEIADLVAMAKANWKLKPAQQRQLDYARAMSLQNLGDANQALPMWAELAKDVNVDPAFRAYAMYYMAKAAMERQDLRKVFVYAQEALTLLLQTNGDPEKIKDTVLMSIYATERSGRYNEALKWAKEYDRYIDADNPEWASTRFKLARIYRKAGAIEEWKQLLGDIIERKPDSLQAQLAKSALDTYELEQQAQQYSPAPQ